MYYDFYQLTENPFNVTADPDFFFSSKHHTHAFSSLVYGIEQRKGIVVITGEVGTGKTTLLKKLTKHFDHEKKFALILNPCVSEIQLLQMIHQDLGLQQTQRNKISLIQSLNEYLLSEFSKGHNVILLIDEAQNLGKKQLEQIRLLSNLETDKEKLIQIILIGQPELHQKLQLNELRQLRQRIAVHYHLTPLDKEDIFYYIEHRIKKAMRDSKQSMSIQFSEDAIEKIYKITHGYPRTINMLCDRALLASFVVESFYIDKNMIENCAKEILYCEHH